MSAKVNLGHGLFAATLNRGPRAGRMAYYGRVWIKSEGRVRYFALKGSTEPQARKHLGAIGLDPEKELREREARKATRTAGPALTFAALADAFLAGYRGSMKGHRNGLRTNYYAHVAKSWKAYFKGAAADVARADVEAYRDHLRREGYGDSTTRKYVGTVGTLYRWGIKAGMVKANPADGVDRPPEPDGLIDILTRDEEPRFLEHLDDDHRLACELYLAGGFRLTEGLDLRWGQVNRGSGEILIHASKTNRPRAVPLNGTLAGILARALARLRSDILRKDIEAGRAPEAYVLCYSDGRPLDRFKLARAIREALEVAEIVKRPGACGNLLRHTFGSRLAEKGIEMPVIATLMGNSPEIAFRHYIRFSPAHLKGAMAALDGKPAAVPRGGRGLKSRSATVTRSRRTSTVTQTVTRADRTTPTPIQNHSEVIAE